MLLPLYGVTPAGRLREDVRFEAVCLALGGNDLREAAHADASK